MGRIIFKERVFSYQKLVLYLFIIVVPPNVGYVQCVINVLSLHYCRRASLNMFVRKHMISLFVLWNRLSHYWLLSFWTWRNKPLVILFGCFTSVRLKRVFILLIIRWSLRSVKAKKWGTLPICSQLLSLVRLLFPFKLRFLSLVWNVFHLLLILTTIFIITVSILWHMSNHYFLDLRFVYLFLNNLVGSHLGLIELKIHLKVMF